MSKLGAVGWTMLAVAGGLALAGTIAIVGGNEVAAMRWRFSR